MFKVGDVVTLKSGGPHMTVATDLRINSNNTPVQKCIWMVSSDPQCEEFPPGTLEIVALP